MLSNSFVKCLATYERQMDKMHSLQQTISYNVMINCIHKKNCICHCKNHNYFMLD